jgi:transposase
MRKYIRIGVDIAKNCFQVHALESEDCSATKRRLSRPKRKGALCDWLAALRARKPPKVVAVALANKLARIVWAIITTGEVFRTSIYAKA